MDDSQTALWNRIDDHKFDESDVALSFSVRLARENNWQPDFAQRVIQEYKKFIFLAVTTGHAVTPSEEVDQVWHLHLLYTRSYWGDFCQLLGEPLHHDPTKGGFDEEHKFKTGYEHTLRSYERVFMDAPPPDIWPEPEKRFANSADFKRLNTCDYWLISKAPLDRVLRIAFMFALLSVLVGINFTAVIQVSGFLFLLLFPFVVTWVSVVAFDKASKNREKYASSNGGGGGCGGGGDGGCGGGCGGCGG